MITISQNFDAGAIEVVRAERADQIDLKIRKDSSSDFAQWFFFRLQGVRQQACTLRFLNIAQTAYPDSWQDYRVVASYDLQNWFRVDTSCDGQVMTVQHTPAQDGIYYAYFEPYSWQRHQETVARFAQLPGVSLENLGATLDGREMDLLVLGNPAAERKIWVIARQHPGESMAEWFVEGMLDALLDRANPLGRCLLAHAQFFVVPNMNPDGSVRGNLRTNASGANLNREWMTPSLATSPEVLVVKNKMHATGCDMFFDVHGDEALPYNFVAGNEMLAEFSPEMAKQQQDFIDQYKLASPDFQDKFGYPASKYNADMLKLASKYVGHHFKCLALTLEMPFKDNANFPDTVHGWDGARSRQLGAAILQPIWHCLQQQNSAANAKGD